MKETSRNYTYLHNIPMSYPHYNHYITMIARCPRKAGGQLLEVAPGVRHATRTLRHWNWWVKGKNTLDLFMTGWWFGTFFIFRNIWECHHPNWRTHIFQRGRSTTKQMKNVTQPVIKWGHIGTWSFWGSINPSYVKKTHGQGGISAPQREQTTETCVASV